MSSFQEFYGAVRSKRELEPAVLSQALGAILGGHWLPSQVAAFVSAVGLFPLSVGALVAAAQEMRAVMLPFPGTRSGLVDTCGTGGDGQHSVNLSTGAAIILASLGTPVAKHGNRAASSQSGSADVLEALGVRLDLTPAAEAKLLEEVGIAFLFAQKYHPALRFIGPVRRELGVRTLFNCLGPLANPARAEFQLLGAYEDSLRPLLGESLHRLGCKRAWVIRSEDGMDEISPFAPTRVTEVTSDGLRELAVTPEDFGLARSAPGAVAGGTPAENAKILETVLRGEEHPSKTAFVLNAAAALVVERQVEPKEAANLVQTALTSGRVWDAFVAFRDRSVALSGASV